jgi:hypothetical protein
MSKIMKTIDVTLNIHDILIFIFMSLLIELNYDNKLI